jgi:hypothetical protein
MIATVRGLKSRSKSGCAAASDVSHRAPSAAVNALGLVGVFSKSEPHEPNAVYTMIGSKSKPLERSSGLLLEITE